MKRSTQKYRQNAEVDGMTYGIEEFSNFSNNSHDYLHFQYSESLVEEMSSSSKLRELTELT